MYIRPVTDNGQPGTLNLPPAMFGGAAIVAPTPPVAASLDLATEIKQLKALKDQGVLTEDEFQRAKEKVLSAPK
jgi:hypothetical protein